MGRRYPYQRFLQINLTALEQLRYDVLSLQAGGVA